MSKRNRYTDDFKREIVNLYKKGKSVISLCKQYNLLKVTIYHWIKQDKNSGSFKTNDNLTDTERDLIKANKRIKHLEMENDILKQAALIIGRR